MSEVKLLKIEVEVCKESHEVFDAIAHLVSEIRQGKDALEIAASSLPKVMTAVEGAQHIEDETKVEQFYDTAGLGASKLAKAILKKKA